VNVGTAVVLTITDQFGNDVVVPGPVQVQVGGTYSITGVDISTLTDGPLTITAQTTDLSSNAIDDDTTATLNALPGDLTLSIDNIAEAAGVITMTVSGTTDDVPATADKPTSVVTITVTDQYGNSVTGTANMAADGSYTTDINISTLSDGPLTAVATALDNNGNTLTDNDNALLDERTGAITVVLNDNDPVSAADQANTEISGTTTDVPAGSTVTLLVKDQFGIAVLVTATVTNVNAVTGIGEYTTTADLSTLADGPLTVTATAVDNNGVTVSGNDNGVKDSLLSDITVTMVDVTQANVTTVAISGTTADVQPGRTVTLTISDGVNPDVIVTTTVQLGGNYSTTADLSSLADGAITVTASVQDQNGATITDTDPSSKDTTPPTLTITSADASLANGAITEVTFTFSEAVQNFVAGDVQVAGGALSNFQQITPTTWTADFTADGSATISISVASSTFNDLVGNQGVGHSLTLNNAPVGTNAAAASTDSAVFSYETSTMFTDVEPGALTYSIVGAPAGITINAATGLISGTLASGASQGGVAGVYTVVVTATDSKGAASTANLALTVTNPAPITIAALSDVTANDAQTLSIPTAGVFRDPDGDTLTYSIANAPAGLTINPATGVISGTLGKSDSQGGVNGEYTVTVTANDGQGGSVDSTFTLQVNNPVPVVTPLPGSAGEDGKAVNISTAGAFSDPDGDVLTYDAVGLPTGLSINPTTGVITGTLQTNASQQGPANDGVYKITITATDADGASVTDILDLTVTNPTPTVTAPLADTTGNDGAAVNIATAGAFTDEDVLTYSATGLPSGLSINPTTGVITGTLLPNASQGGPAVNGVYIIVVTANDNQGGIATDTFTLTVSNVAPDAVNDTGTTNEDTVLTVNAANGVLKNDSSGDGDVITVSQITNGTTTVGPAGSVTGSKGGIFTINADGSYTFNPDGKFEHLGQGQSDTSSVTYTISDGQGGTDTATLTVTITGVNDDPEAQNDVSITGKNNTIAIDVLANDTDIDAIDVLFVSHIEGNAIASGQTLVIAGGHEVTRNANGTLSFKPANNYDGVVDFNYTVSDGKGGTDVASVKVNVISVDIKDNASLTSPGVVNNGLGDNVLASIDNLTTTVITGKIPVGGTIAGDLVITDSKGATVTVDADDIAIFPTGKFTTTANISGLEEGNLTVTLIAKDVGGNQATTTDVILKDTITEVAINPLLVVNGQIPTITGTGEANSTITIRVDGNILGTATVIANGTWSYTPAVPVPADVFEIRADAEDRWGNTNLANGNPARDTREVPTLTLDDMNGGAAGHLTVLEPGLADGSSPDPTEVSKTGTFTLSTGLVETLNRLVVGGTNVSKAQLDNLENSGTVINAINTTYGQIQITDFDSGTGVVTYVYRLLDNTTAHPNAAGNNTVTDSIVIDVVDQNGDIRRDTLNAVVVDDMPEPIDDVSRSIVEGGAAITGNLLTNDTLGADGARVYDFSYTDRNGDPQTSVVTASSGAANNSVTVLTRYGSLTVQSNGNWTYTPLATAPHGAPLSATDEDISDDFTYRLIDNDGDISTTSATQPIVVTDTVPEVGTPDNRTVNEQNLPAGTAPNAGALTRTGSLDITRNADSINTTFDAAQTGLDAFGLTLTSGGTPVTYSISPNGHVLTATAGGNTVFTVTINNPTSANPGYTFVFSRPLDHHFGNDEIDLPFNFTVTDSDGDTATGQFTVTVVDDARPLGEQEIELDEDGTITFITTADGTFANTSIYDAVDAPHLMEAKFGTVTIGLDGRLTYTPDPNYSGPDRFEYEIDQNGSITKVTVDVIVNPVTDVPTFTRDAANITTDEDVAIALGFNVPVITDDTRAPLAPEDYPERLGPITLSGFPVGAKLLDGTNGDAELHSFATTSVTIRIQEYVTGSNHTNTAGTLTLTQAQFEALKVLPPANSSENFTVTGSVQSFEVDAAGDQRAGILPKTTTITVAVQVLAVTDDVVLKINGLDEHDVLIDEDTSLDLSALLSSTLIDLDGSERHEIRITNPVGNETIYVNGNAVTAGNFFTIAAPGLSANAANFPAITITVPEDFSGDLEGITVTLRAEDTDVNPGDNLGGNPIGDSPHPTNPGLKTDSVTLNLYVGPKADEITSPNVSTLEDTPVKFMENMALTDTDGSEEITAIVINEVPTGWVIRDAGGNIVHTGNGVANFTVPNGDIANDNFRDYTITPRAHSSVDETLLISATSTDTKTVDGALMTDDETTDISVRVVVTAVAERVDNDSNGAGGNDVTINPAHTYIKTGKEDEWFALHEDAAAGFNLAPHWSNEDNDGSEKTFAMLTPVVTLAPPGDGSPMGSAFRYFDGTDWVVQTFNGTAVLVPMEYLNTLEFRGAPYQAAVYDITVQARTVDTDPETGVESVATSGTATLGVIFLEPVANDITIAVTSPAQGLEDTNIPLSIRPRSDDPSEIFTVTIKGVPADAILNYKGNPLVPDGDGDYIISQFDQSATLNVRPPLHSNTDFVLTVEAYSVDAFNGVSSVSATETITLNVDVRGVADPAIITIAEPDYLESDLDSNGNLVSLTDVYTTLERTDTDGSELLTVRITGLPAGFTLVGGGTFIGGAGAGRTWIIREAEFANISIHTPSNFSGTVNFTGRAVTTENDGNAWTGALNNLKFTVTPAPEAEIVLSSTVDEDTVGRINFNVAHRNGDTNESVSEVWISAADVADLIADGVSLYFGNGTSVTLADAAANAGVPSVVLDAGWYKLTGAAFNNIYAKGAYNETGTYKFVIRYQITDPSTDGTLPAQTAWSDDTYELIIAAVTDPFTIVVSNITVADPAAATVDVGDAEVTATANTTVFVEVTLSKNPDSEANNERDYDGSENLLYYIIDNVPHGVTVKDAIFIGETSTNSNTGQWRLDLPNTPLNGPIVQTLEFHLAGTAAQLQDLNDFLRITAYTQDTGPTGPAETLSSFTGWLLVTPEDALGFTGGAELPAVILPSEQNPDYESDEEVLIQLNELIDASIDTTGTSETFAVTIDNLPPGATVTGMTQITLAGETLWSASGSGGNAALQALLASIRVRPPANFNSNHGPFVFDVTLTTYANSGQQNVEIIPVSHDIDPISDPVDIGINMLDDSPEGADVDISIAVNNGPDGAFANLVDGILYVTVNDAGMNAPGVLLDNTGTPLVQTAVDGVAGIPDGNYYVFNGVDLGDTVSLVYRPNGTASGAVSVSARIQSQEDNAPNTVTALQSDTVDINPVNSGYHLDVADSTGAEDTLIQLDVQSASLIDNDGSESVVSVLLRNLPNGFLVFTGANSGSATLANNVGDDGSGLGNNIWSIPTPDGQLPAFIGIRPPQHWSGSLSGLELAVLTAEQDQDTVETVADFDLSVTGVADGLGLNPALSFGVAGEKIPLSLNANMVDVDGSETVTLTFTNLGQHAAFYTNAGNLLLAASYDAAAGGSYTLTGLTSAQVNDLYLVQAARTGTVQITARTVESDGDISAPVTRPMNLNITQPLATAGNDTFLFGSATAINGGAGTDTVMLRLGESLDFSAFPGARPQNIEIFDLGQAGANNLTNVKLADVLAMTDGNKTLTILGDAADTVTLLNDDHVVSTWQLVNADDGGFSVYTHATDPAVIVRIENLIDKSIID
jgi:large repetitive protein